MAVQNVLEYKLGANMSSFQAYLIFKKNPIIVMIAITIATHNMRMCC